MSENKEIEQPKGLDKQILKQMFESSRYSEYIRTFITNVKQLPYEERFKLKTSRFKDDY